MNRLLDLVFCKSADIVSVVPSCAISKVDPYHVPIYLFVSAGVDGNTNIFPVNFVFNFRKADYNAHNRYYSSIEWKNFLNNVDIDSVLNVCYEKLFHGFSKFIPIANFNKSKRQSWMNRSVSLGNRRLSKNSKLVELKRRLNYICKA